MEKVILSKFCKIKSGYAFKSSEFVNDGYPIIRIGNIKNNNVELDDVCYPEEFLNDEKNKNYIVDKGSVLIAMSGATVGKVGIYDRDEIALLNQRVGCFCCNSEMRSKYLYYFLKFDGTREFVLSKATGCAQPNISNKQLENLEIPYRSKDEQDDIIEELDTISKMMELKRKELDYSNDLIESLYQESIKDNYTEAKLCEIGKALIGLTYKPSDINDSGMIVLRSGNIQNGDLDFNDIVKVGIEVPEKKQVKNGDILICSRNGSRALVGKSALIKGIKEPMSFGAFMSIFRSEINQFLIAFFHSDDFRNQLGQSSTATINQITNDMLNNIVVKLPSKDKIESVSKKILEIEKQKECIKNTINELEKLMEIKLHLYFGV